MILQIIYLTVNVCDQSIVLMDTPWCILRWRTSSNPKIQNDKRVKDRT